MLSFIFSSLLLLGASAAEENLDCGPGKLLVHTEARAKVEKGQFCTNERATVLISEKFDRGRVKGKRVPDFESVNPGFVYCEALGGDPEFVEIVRSRENLELDRCLFPDGTYIDTGSLYKLGRDQKFTKKR